MRFPAHKATRGQISVLFSRSFRVTGTASLDNAYIDISGREQRAYVIRVVTSNFRAGNFSNDIALLQLQEALRLDGKRIAAVCLPQPGQQYSSGESASTRTAVQKW